LLFFFFDFEEEAQPAESTVIIQMLAMTARSDPFEERVLKTFINDFLVPRFYFFLMLSNLDNHHIYFLAGIKNSLAQ
jgi:hypothetical protein